MVHYPYPTKDIRVATLNRDLLLDKGSSSTMGRKKRSRRRRRDVVSALCPMPYPLCPIPFTLCPMPR